jgi:hypothetical protein
MDTINIIYGLLDEDSKINLSKVNMLYYKIYTKNIKKLILIQKEDSGIFYMFKSLFSYTDQYNILIKIVSARPNIKYFELTNFDTYQQQYIYNLVKYFELHPPQFEIIKINKCFDESLGSRFCESIGGEKLRKIVFNYAIKDMSQKNLDINPCLRKSPNLKSIIFNCAGCAIENINFEFNTELTTIDFIDFTGISNIFESLKNCLYIESFVFHTYINCTRGTSYLINNLASFQWTQIKKLKLINIPFSREIIPVLQNYPNLEYLNIELRQEIDIGNYCPNLKILQLDYENFIKTDFKLMLSNLPKLKALQITYLPFDSDCLKTIADTFPKLQVLTIFRNIILNHADIINLTEKCSDLVILQFYENININPNTAKCAKANLKNLYELLLNSYCEESSFLAKESASRYIEDEVFMK